MRKKGIKVVRFAIVLAAVLTAGFLLFRFAGVPASWAPSVQSEGDTPFEKASSVVKYLNAQKSNDFARVFLSEHDFKEGSWLYTVMVNEPDLLAQGKVSPVDLKSQQSAQLKQRALFEIIGRIFAETAKFDESAKVITVKVISPIALDTVGLKQGFVYKAEKDAVSRIRKNAEAWKEVLRDSEPLLAFYPSMNRMKTTEIDGKTPSEKVTSLVAFLNDRTANDFERVFFDEYDGEKGIWKYTVLVTDPSIFKADADIQKQIVKQFRVEMHWDNIKNLFVRTSEWDDTAKGISVRIISPNPIDRASFVHGFIYGVNEIGVQNVRKYPDNWAFYAGTQDDKTEKLLLVPQSFIRELVEHGSQQ